eukprot:scaffold91749_cov63-Phaeocystis_antarctica.AAC.3
MTLLMHCSVHGTRPSRDGDIKPSPPGKPWWPILSNTLGLKLSSIDKVIYCGVHGAAARPAAADELTDELTSGAQVSACRSPAEARDALLDGSQHLMLSTAGSRDTRPQSGRDPGGRRGRGGGWLVTLVATWRSSGRSAAHSVACWLRVPGLRAA